MLGIKKISDEFSSGGRASAADLIAFAKQQQFNREAFLLKPQNLALLQSSLSLGSLT